MDRITINSRAALRKTLGLLGTIGLVFSTASCFPAAANAQGIGIPRSNPIADESDVSLWESSPIGPISYRPARGLIVGDTGLQIGGFGTTEFDREEGKALQVELDNISFLIRYEPIEAFRIFAEIEVGGLFTHQARGATDSDPSFETERLFGELSLSDRFNLRFGKFQTPIGRWNLVPAEPFVWTASDPVLIETAFDEHQTGVSMEGTFFPDAGALEYWIYAQVIDPLDPSDSPPPTARSMGGRLQFTTPRQAWSVGASFLASERKDDWSTLVGLDAEFRVGNFELSTEAAYQRGEIPDRHLAGIFLQGRYEPFRGFHLLARYEYFDRLGSPVEGVHLGDLGFAWQPLDWLIFKATYRVSDRRTEDVDRGLSSSISVVF